MITTNEVETLENTTSHRLLMTTLTETSKNI